MEGTHEVGWRPFMPASTLSGRSVALLRVRLDDCTPSEGQLISHGNCARSFLNHPSHSRPSFSIPFFQASELEPRFPPACSLTNPSKMLQRVKTRTSKAISVGLLECSNQSA